ncbi:hypothetical protein ASPZODRAFT_152775 [Penicilliopsis zonata CBS 506.65]|uniref:Ketoreductase (KR) domain-containing protein n=1 Tax=Penicilliopsis zonata CBS 506.65 TaxID=1073090 RepID=A0A1L9SEV5_9EURO|nr:hypothetical protein ASPZODRAFT_152775 [Penicilliopsis zonata CBS 506.65]OJJ45785.1 hypothetical protein ASPZODRAFT_152775 [Penicilliopsis zonata CBS 506.65]
MLSLLRSQLVFQVPPPTASFTGQTIIVTGANTGLGLEAARQFVRHDARRVILAVRDMAKGTAAKSDIDSHDNDGKCSVEVWQVDLTSYESVEAFSQRAAGLDRVDVLVANAGVYLFDFSLAEDNEATITVNVLSTLLLGIRLLPKLRETSVALHKPCVMTFAGSFVHKMTTFPERKKEKIFAELARPNARMIDRYNVSKLIQLLLVRELANKVTLSSQDGHVIVSTVNPGLVKTSIMRHARSIFAISDKIFKALLARTPEDGGNTLVHAASGGDETHGQYLDDCSVGRVSSFVSSEEGHLTQQQLWREMCEILRIPEGSL